MDPTIAPTIAPGGPVTARGRTEESPTERADASSSRATKKSTSSASSGVSTSAARVSAQGCFGSLSKTNLSKAHWRATAQAHALPLPSGWSEAESGELAQRIPSAMEALRDCAPAAARLHHAATLAAALAPASSAEPATLAGAAGGTLAESVGSKVSRGAVSQEDPGPMPKTSETGDLVGAAGNAYDVLAGLEKKLAGLDPKSDAFSRELIVLQQKIGSVTRLIETISNILDMKDQVSRSIIRNIS